MQIGKIVYLDYGCDLVSVRERNQAFQRYLRITDVRHSLVTEGISKTVPKIEK